MRGSKHSIIAFFGALALTSCQQPVPQAPEAASEASRPLPAPVAASEAVEKPPQNSAPSLAIAPPDQRPPKAARMCNIEALNGQPFGGEPLSATVGVLEVSGWVGDETTRTVPADPELRLEVKDDSTKAWRIAVKPGITREDVVAASGEAGLRESGFSVSVPAGGLMPGVYHMYIAYSSGAERYVCDNGRLVELKAPAE